jgi:sugar phosphate isomerase/epimerase
MTNHDNLRARLGCRILFDNQTIAEAARWAARVGFKAIEVNLNDPRYFPEGHSRAARTEARAAAEDSGVALLFHAPEDLCLASMQGQMRDAGLARLATMLDFAADLGGKCVTFHLGAGQVYWKLGDRLVTLHDVYPDQVRANLRDTLSRIRDHHAGDVAPCLENAGYFGQHVVQELLDEMLPAGGLYLTWDVGHANLKSRQGEEHDEFFLRHLGSLRNVHLHDNDGSSDRHGLPGTGNVDFSRYFRVLSDVPSWLILEVGPREKALAAMGRLEEWLGKPH